MSGLDPLAAALAAQAAAAAQSAMDEAILSLGADITVLQSQISVGDVVAATVLPPQGGTDRLSFLGQTVSAQIPPGVNPGESLLLQVTAFTNIAVIVKNLGTVDPENPLPTVGVQLPPPAAETPQSAVLTTVLPQAASPSPPSPPPAPANPAAAGSVAPPREVFIAAALRAAPSVVPRADAAAVRANAPPLQAVETSDLEARIALTRASASAPPLSPNGTAPKAAAAPPPELLAPGRLPVAPPIVLSASPRTPTAASVSAPPNSAGPAPEPQTPEAALLARLNVPVTSATLAAARLAGNATASLTGAYERLETLLGRLAPEEIPVALRSVLGFVSRMDLRNAAALPEQIAAFVADVVDGPEAKIAQAVAAWLDLSPEEIPAQPAAPSLPGAPLTVQQSMPAPTPAEVTTATAQAAERVVALQFDAKSSIMEMLTEQSSAPASAALAGALRDALAATTAVQLGALSAQSVDPSSITLALPAYFYNGGTPVQLQISRDAPNSKNKMDGDNFHIAFVLDTASLGTVAIDVQTVGRAVSVDVKTQGASAADRFRNTLGDLRGRLERLRYRVSTIAAGVAAPLGTQAPQAAPPAAPQAHPVHRGLWDTRA